MTATYFAIAGLFAMLLHSTVYCSYDHFSGEDFIRANNKFGLELYKRTSRKENQFISPISISSALCVVYTMSSGNTSKELSRVMNFATDRHEVVAAAYRQARECLKRREIKMANAIFLDNRFPLKHSFKDAVKREMGALSENLDFSSGIENSRRYINNFVDLRTNHMIPEFLSKEFSQSGPKSMVLCSATQFKNDWANPFDKTMKGNFHSIDGTVRQVDMMFSASSHFGLATLINLRATALRINYAGGYHSMVILLPETSLEVLVKKLESMDLFEDVIKKVPRGSNRGQQVLVTMPKFNLTCETPLESVLMEMGAKSLFNGQGDFSKATDHKNLVISKVSQKAAIMVDEKGTQAAAATGMEVTLLSMPPSIVLNRPFLFIIHDNDCKTVLYIGHISKL